MKNKNIRNWMSLFAYSSYYLKLSWIFILFWRPKKILTKIKPPKKILAKFSYPKISRNQKFQTPKILLSSLTRENPEYPPGALPMSDIICMGFCWIHYKTISPSKISLKHDTMNWSIWMEWIWTGGMVV